MGATRNRREGGLSKAPRQREAKEDRTAMEEPRSQERAQLQK